MTSETRTCQNCKNQFAIEPDDFGFYEKIKVPPPTFCWRCRLQRRLTWRNERALYKRNCDLCQNPIFSMYPAGTKFPVYCHNCWFSDQWDPLSYGRDYDFKRSFFEQIYELQQVVPRSALKSSNSVNSDYSNQIANCKNCYLITSGSEDEDCMFSYRILNCRRVLDSFALTKCENSYECSLGRESNRVFFSQGFADSYDLYFCDEPRGSQNCFMSVNLRRKSHVFRGEQLSKEDYQRKFSEIDFGSYKVVEELKSEFSNMVINSLRPHGTFKNTVNTTGNALANTKNCTYCFHGSNLENCHYCFLIDDAKDSMDVNNGCCTMELAYEVCTTGVKAANIKFSVDAWPDVFDLEYCDGCCSGDRNLFGCVSVRNKEYCILNKQYSPAEYANLKKKIVAQMDEVAYTDRGGRIYKYGEFFPAELSPFPYNDSVAQDHFRLTAAEVVAQGWRWQDSEKNAGITLSAQKIPDNIRDTKEEIIKEIIGCEHEGECNERCTLGFRIVPEELQFYIQNKLPLPRLCPNCRHYQRLAKRNPLNLWKRECACNRRQYKNSTTHFHGNDPCPNQFQTSYAPDRPEMIYCEQCYNAEIV